MLPERIGPYEILEPLGAGGMGNVFRARQVSTQQEVAIKVLPSSLAGEPGFVERFQREVQALKAVRNPHVVEVYDEGVDGDQFFYAMEYVPGETLTARIRRDRRLPWQDAIEIARQLCVGLKGAHDAGIVHRDIKPSNILLRTDGQVKLTDFGVAQLFSAEKLTATGGVIGTAEYMAPEQAQGERAGKRSDLYSLGAVLYAMLTGRPPYSGPTAVDVMHKHRYGQYERVRALVIEVPIWLEELIAELLQKDPAKRPPDAYVVARRLVEIVNKVQLQQQEKGDLGPDETQVDMSRQSRSTVSSGLPRTASTPLSSPATGSSSWTDNAWLLGGVLCLLMGLVWWLQTPATLSSEQQLARGKAWLESESPENWERARQECFAPLMATDTARWRTEVEPLLLEIDRRQLEARLAARQPGRNKQPLSTEEIWLRQSRQLWMNGQTTQAAEQLRALLAVVPATDEYRVARLLATGWLQELTTRVEPQQSPVPLLQAALAQAQAQIQSHPETAREQLQAIQFLGQADPRAQEVVTAATALLQQLP